MLKQSEKVYYTLHQKLSNLGMNKNGSVFNFTAITHYWGMRKEFRFEQKIELPLEGFKIGSKCRHVHTKQPHRVLG